MEVLHSTRFKKLIACMLSIVMVCTILFYIAPANLMADILEDYAGDSLIYEDFKYKVLSDGTIEITDYHGPGGLVTIPSTIEGRRVSKLGYRSFNADPITSVIIPDSVTTIGEAAFFCCTSLTNVTIPNSVEVIDELAFSCCDSLTSVYIPSSVISIAQWAFESCCALTDLTISNGVTYIGSAAFEGCGITSVIIPESVTSIGAYAFSSCGALTSITVLNRTVSLSSWAFDGYVNRTIYCYSNSTALTYANEYRLEYVLLDEVPLTPTPTQTPTNVATPGPIPPPTGNTVDRSAAEAFVTRCYELVLNRTPDSTGLNNWTNSLVNNQNTGAHMAYGFFFSPEYLNSNTSNEEFVTTLYNVFLDRQPDPSGLADWVGQLEAGASREQVFAGVANSREFFGLCNGYGITAGHYVQGLDNSQQQNVNAFVARLYSMCLGRNGDYDGQASWVRQLINHENSGAGVGYGFFFSPEFINRNLTNEEYVATLYRVFLGREPDQAGFNSWVMQLNGGADRLSIFRGFAHSQEYTNICSSYGIERGTI